MILSVLLIAVISVLALGRLSKVVVIISAISMFHLCGHNCCCYCFCNEQHCLLCSATMSTLLSAMTTQKSLTNAFVAMAVADRPASLQALWRFFDDEGLRLAQSSLLQVLCQLHNC
jgi:hypothetical protein